MVLIAIFMTLIFVYSTCSKQLERTSLTAPILFTAAGMVVYPLLTEIPTREHDAGIFLRVAEVGLVLLLFTDASRTQLWVLRRIENLPLRLLTAGMLLTIALGAAAALALFSGRCPFGRRAFSPRFWRRRTRDSDRSLSTASTCRCGSAKP